MYEVIYTTKLPKVWNSFRGILQHEPSGLVQTLAKFEFYGDRFIGMIDKAIESYY